MFEKIPFYGQVLIFAFVAFAIIGVAYYVAPNLKEMGAQIEQLEADPW